MDNFLYAFDENYNIQGYCSIVSLLENSQSEVNIYIIHKDPETFNSYKEKIIINKNLGKLEILKFNNKNYKFPNLENKHVSEATYYRIFIDEYLPDSVENFLYVDADAFFINHFQIELNKANENLMRSNYIISATANSHKNDDNRRRLNLKEYFNAGVILVNYDKWRKNNVSSKLKSLLQDETLELEFWDQDLLNIYFNGNFETLSSKFNFMVYGDQKDSLDSLNNIANNATIVHYSGKHKPWSPKGVFSKESYYYLELYRRLFNKKYHIVNIYSKNTLKILIKNIFNLKLLKLEYPLSYASLVIKSVLKKS